MACVTANSRLSYAFSRDSALPLSHLWARITPRTGTPTNSIWLCAGLSFVLTLPAVVSQSAFFAVTSVAVIGLYIACAAPILLRRPNPDSRAGVWNLGRWSGLIGCITVAWVAFVVMLFLLSQYYPGTPGDPTFDYAPVAVSVVVPFALASWSAGGRKHFMRDDSEGLTEAERGHHQDVLG